MSSPLTRSLSARHIPERDVFVLPFEVSWEVVVFPDVRNATPGLIHQLQSVVIQVTCHLQGQNMCAVFTAELFILQLNPNNFLTEGCLRS